jgi:hypothetical protein
LQSFAFLFCKFLCTGGGGGAPTVRFAPVVPWAKTGPAHTTKDADLNIACAWNSVKAKSMLPAWRKLWPAVMAGEGASDEFVGFNIRNKDTVHEMESMFEKNEPLKPRT